MDVITSDSRWCMTMTVARFLLTIVERDFRKFCSVTACLLMTKAPRMAFPVADIRPLGGHRRVIGVIQPKGVEAVLRRLPYGVFRLFKSYPPR